MKSVNARFIARAALIAAVYAVVTVILAPISYGQIQVRVSEMLTVLAYLDPAAILGLYVGAFLANLRSPFGPIDYFFGSFLTLAAAIVTYFAGRFFERFSKKIFYYIGPLVALLPVVVFNAFGVAYILKVAAKLPFLLSALYVGAGELIAVYLLGYPFLLVVIRLGIYESK